MKAAHYGVVAPQDNGLTVVTVCAAEADRTSATVSITCSIDDPAPGVVSEECDSPASHGACGPVVLTGGSLPVTVCSHAVATFSDDTTATDTNCKTYGV